MSKSILRWEFDSVCPKCNKVTHVISSPGELTVRVHCDHCEHGYDYTHIVREHVEIEINDEKSIERQNTNNRFVASSRVYIVGAGYAGMSAAVELQKHHVPFTLLNRHDYHYFKTLLHEAAGGRDEPFNYAIHVDDILLDPIAQFEKLDVVRIDIDSHEIHTTAGTRVYDKLIVALGSQTSDFGIPGVREHGLMLNTLRDAKYIRHHIEDKIKLYTQTNDLSCLRFVVGGGGLTGVELIGELADFLPRLLAQYKVNPRLLDLILVHSHDQTLIGIDEKLRDIAKERLINRNVQFILKERVVEVNHGEIALSSGDMIEAQTFIWAGGISANPILELSGFSIDNQGRAIVNENLQSVDDPDVYIVGDCAHYRDKEGNVLSPTGQVAEQMGEHAAVNVLRCLNNKNQISFLYHHRGLAVSLGPHYGVAEVGHLRTSGFAAMAVKDGSKAKYLMHLGGIHALIYKRKQRIDIE